MPGDLVVADASVVAATLIETGPVGRRARQVLGGAEIVAPHLVDLEVTSVIRRHLSNGLVDSARANAAMQAMAAFPMRRVGHQPVLPRVWELRGNLSPYDAAYVALAERLAARLITLDERLAKAPGPSCEIQVITAPS